jgi:putative transposase
MRVIRPCLEKEISQAKQAQASGVTHSTVERWIEQYRQDGMRGLVRQERSDKGTRRRLSEEVVKLVEGFALRKLQRSVATIQRQVSAIALQHGWEEPDSHQVYEIVRGLPQALVTLAQEGTRAYQEDYDLLYRREVERPNAIWQADHCLLPILVKDGQGKSARPWLTVIEDDHSRAISGYRLSWSAPSVIQMALALRLASLSQRRCARASCAAFLRCSPPIMAVILRASIWSRWEQT